MHSDKIELDVLQLGETDLSYLFCIKDEDIEVMIPKSIISASKKVKEKITSITIPEHFVGKLFSFID